MQSLKSWLLVVSGVGLLFIGGCAGSSQTTTTQASPAAESSSAPATTESPAASNTQVQGGTGQGGIVVESGVYHLEMKPSREGEDLHLDLFLQKSDNHEAIPGAEVVAQVELPDGSMKGVKMEYDTEGKHYAAKLPGAKAGEYKVVVQSKIDGERLNTRFDFVER